MRDLLDQSTTRRKGFSELDYSLPFDHIQRCSDAPAALSMRERVFLYALVYSLAPQNALEVGTFKGGSAQIISGALDDLGFGGQLLTVDPAPEQIEIEWKAIAHNATQLPGFFPKDFKTSTLAKGILFGFAFIDGDHSFKGLGRDLEFLHRVLAPGAYVLLHDAYNPEVERAIERAVRRSGYHDCGRQATVGSRVVVVLHPDVQRTLGVLQAGKPVL